MKKFILSISIALLVLNLSSCGTVGLLKVQNNSIKYYIDKYGDTDIEAIKTKYVTERDPIFGDYTDKNSVYIITDRCTIYADRDDKDADWKYEDDKQVEEVVELLHNEVDEYYKSLGYNFNIVDFYSSRRGFKQLYTEDKDLVKFLQQENAEIDISINLTDISEQEIKQFISITDSLINLKADIWLFICEEDKLSENLETYYWNDIEINNGVIYIRHSYGDTSNWEKYIYNKEKQQWEEVEYN